MHKYNSERNKHRDDLQNLDDECLRDIYTGALEIMLERADIQCRELLAARPDIKELMDERGSARYVMSLLSIIEVLAKELNCLGGSQD